MDYKFKRYQINKISREKIIEELKNVAKFYNYTRFTRHDFDKVARICKGTTVLNVFGAWKDALDSIGYKLTERKIDRNIISNKKLFEEMERIWNLVGQRPSQAEWELSSPSYSYTTYKSRFNGWKNACLKFIEYKMGQSIDIDEGEERAENIQERKKFIYKESETRTIPLGLRIKVLNRDNYRCVKCGRSPATDVGIKLHLDHKIAFSQGGKSTEENLQTLCQDCNIGKGNKIL